MIEENQKSTEIQEMKGMLNRHLLFLILFFLTVIKPTAAQSSSRYTGFIAEVLVLGAFLFVIIRGNHWRYFWDKFRLEVILLVALGGSLTLSLIVNHQRYPAFADFVFYGAAPLFIMFMLPMCYVIFKAPFNSYRNSTAAGQDNWLWLGLALLMLIHLLGLAPFFFDEQMAPIYSSTFSGEVFENKTESILISTTGYGVLAALTCIFSLSMAVETVQVQKLRILAYATFFVGAVGGFLSSSRNFLWTLMVGLLVLGIQRLRNKRHLVYALLILVCLTGVFHIVMFQVPGIGKRFTPFVPYMGKIQNGEDIQPGDFVPDWDMEDFGKRDEIWGKAISLWQQHPWLGIGFGGFRMDTEFRQVLNVHNIYLQVLTEGGMAGLILFLSLITAIIRRMKRHPAFSLFLALLAALVFDNFLDYSKPFVISVGYMLALLSDFRKESLY